MLSLQILFAERDDKHYSVHKNRSCFLWNNQYFQLDQYADPCPKRLDFCDIEQFSVPEPNALVYNCHPSLSMSDHYA